MKTTRFFLTILFFFLFVLTSYSQFKEYDLKIGLQGNYLLPANEYSEEEYNPSLLFRPHIGFQLTPVLDLEAGIGYGWFQGEDYSKDKYKSSFIPLDVRLLLSPVNSDYVNPYLYLGIGGSYWWLDDKPANPVSPPADDNGINGLGELGLGIEFALNKNWVVGLTAGFNIFSDDNINGDATNLQDKALHDYDRYTNIGLDVSYVKEGCSSDEDNDGINRCDELALGADPNNPDTDNDGLKDGEELNIYKTNLLKADTDGDGLLDGEEVNNYKTDPNKADTDGDGLNDGDEVNKYKTDPMVNDTDRDLLSDGEEVNQYKTDPLNVDSDNDGLKDGEEITQYKTEPLNADTDNGSVNDGTEVRNGTNPLDSSDDVPPPPEPAKEIVLEGITFATNSATIATGSDFAVLNKTYDELVENPEMEILVTGHTDNVGKHAYNMTLSKKRADAVKEYLVNKGIAPNRISTEGFGPDKPIAPNETPEGKAKNRRVEIKRIK